MVEKTLKSKNYFCVQTKKNAIFRNNLCIFLKQLILANQFYCVQTSPYLFFGPFGKLSLSDLAEDGDLLIDGCDGSIVIGLNKL